MSSRNCTGVRPLAGKSPMRGKEILPSGRTSTLLEISGSFHTFTTRRSSGPITYSSGADGGCAAGVDFAFDGLEDGALTPQVNANARAMIADLFHEFIAVT